ncbi:MAG: hypothetical protein R3E97_17500 [Candidatus Eisenbacteria bacterium]
MKKVLFSLLGLALCGSVAQANIPDPGFCTVTPADALGGLVVAPLDPVALAATINTINVRNDQNAPIPNAAVTIEFSNAISLCSATVTSGTTDANGDVTLTLGGGGCAHVVALSGQVKANGVTIRNYENVKSPDYDGAAGDLVVNLSDLVVFSAEFLGSNPAECHDYDNNGATNLGDLVVFSPAFVNPNTCN